MEVTRDNLRAEAAQAFQHLYPLVCDTEQVSEDAPVKLSDQPLSGIRGVGGSNRATLEILLEDHNAVITMSGDVRATDPVQVEISEVSLAQDNAYITVDLERSAFEPVTSGIGDRLRPESLFHAIRRAKHVGPRRHNAHVSAAQQSVS